MFQNRARDRLAELARAKSAYDWTGEITGTPIARPSQRPPDGDWRIWLLLAGRGFGKTRTGAEWVRGLVDTRRAGRIALVAPTAADARDVMVEGESGLLAVSPPWNRPIYEPSKRRLTWPGGAIATTYSADEPERLRGPQHDAAWADELAVWRYPQAWDMLLLGLRLGADPRAVVTTTPRPGRLIAELLGDPSVTVTRGTTFENMDNLAPAFIRQIIARYRGTRLERQEIYAEVLSDLPGALWTQAGLETMRVKQVAELARVVVGIDPAVSAGAGANETGIVVAGRGCDGHAYVLDDLSMHGTPFAWAQKAVAAYHKWRAVRIVAEVNQGGEMIESLLRTVDPVIAYRAVRASRGKLARAEPVAALYEQGRCHHVGLFPELEEQMCAFGALSKAGRDAGPGLDRVDALVWALTDLMLSRPITPRIWRL